MSSNDDRLLDKLDRIDARLTRIEVTLGTNTQELADHIRRTELLELQLEEFWDELKPINVHIARMEGALKFLGVVSILISVIGGLLKIFGVI